MKLILIPLSVLILLSVFSMLGLGETIDRTFTFGGDSSQIMYYDQYDSPVCYANGTAVAGQEQGTFKHLSTGSPVDLFALWDNSTGEYTLFYESGEAIYYDSIGSSNNSGTQMMLQDLSGAVGLIGIIIGIMLFATVVGLKVMGSGIGETSVSALIKGTAYLTFWGIFSALSYQLLFDTEMFLMYIIYFILTGIYTLGIINQIGSPE